MEIIVQGKGTKTFVPNEVVLMLTFTTKGQLYEEVLYEGAKNVEYFIDDILLKNNFTKDDMKTRNYIIREEFRYNNDTHKNVFDGYSFNQIASLNFDYDKELLARIMDSLSKMENAPNCQVNFGIKEERECRRSILSEAYKDAEAQALAIAEASGKKLSGCMKVDFKPFTTEYTSRTSFDSAVMSERTAKMGATQTIINTFTPEDIQLTETLYCLWIAE